MNTELLISNIILTLGTWSLVMLAMIKRTKIEQANQSSQEKTFRTIRRIEELLLDGGGKRINVADDRGFRYAVNNRTFQDALDDQAFQDELMKNYIKESINEIIESSRYFDQDYTPLQGLPSMVMHITVHRRTLKTGTWVSKRKTEKQNNLMQLLRPRE